VIEAVSACVSRGLHSVANADLRVDVGDVPLPCPDTERQIFSNLPISSALTKVMSPSTCASRSVRPSGQARAGTDSDSAFLPAQ